MAETSILNDVKSTLGISVDDYNYDVDIIMHINTVLAVVNQLGIGPTNGLMITNYTTLWDALLSPGVNLSLVKTYVCLRVRLLFDPPTTSYMIEAMERQAKELEWRLSVNREGVSWVNPFPVTT